MKGKIRPVTLRKRAEFRGRGKPRNLLSSRAYEGKTRKVTPRTSFRQRAAFEGGGKPENLLSLRAYEEEVRTMTSRIRQQAEFEDCIRYRTY